jgi:hypothetical protein
MSARSISFDLDYPPDRELHTGSRVEKRFQKRREPPGVHAHTAVLFLACRTHQAPRGAWSEAVFAICDLPARLRVLEHEPARILLARFTVIPIAKHSVSLDKHSSNVLNHSCIRDARRSRSIRVSKALAVTDIGIVQGTMKARTKMIPAFLSAPNLRPAADVWIGSRAAVTTTSI